MSSYDGARARALRLESRICIEELAAAAGVSPNTVRNAESGKHRPCPRVAKALAKALGIPLREIAPPGPVLTLRDIRHRLGLTQAEMAERIGVVRQMVSQVERGVTGVSAPLAWATAYGLTPTQWGRAHKTSRDLVRQKVASRARQRRKNELRGDNA